MQMDRKVLGRIGVHTAWHLLSPVSAGLGGNCCSSSRRRVHAESSTKTAQNLQYQMYRLHRGVRHKEYNVVKALSSPLEAVKAKMEPK